MSLPSFVSQHLPQLTRVLVSNRQTLERFQMVSSHPSTSAVTKSSPSTTSTAVA